jgi:hypothetical protein
MKKKILFLGVFALFASATAAQSVWFFYDETGNCTSRRIIMLSASDDALRADGSASLFEEQIDTDLQVKIYPNPTEGLLQVEISGNTDDEVPAILSVFNTGGKQLQIQQAVSNLTLVNLSSYPKGIYILRLLVKDKPTDYKIIKL